MNFLNYPKRLHAWLIDQIEKETEAFEQIKFVEWLEEKCLKFTSSASSTWTPSIMQKMKNKALGLRSGFPDLVIYIYQTQRPIYSNQKPTLVFIEMKRKTKGKVSDAQRDWICSLDSVENVGAYVAKGCDEAIKIVEGLIK